MRIQGKLAVSFVEQFLHVDITVMK